jgi:RNA polymerase sigma-70 factor (ECF subfamily)
VDVHDADLVLLARNGNANAFAELVRRHERSMLALAYAGTRCSATSSDVVQDAFVKCWRKLSDLREPGKFVPWLASTVRRLATNAMRSPVRRFKLAGDTILDERPGAEQPDPLESRDLAEQIDRAIASLDSITASCVVLRYYQDLPSREIGEVVGLSPAAVDMRLSRARTILKEKLARCAPEGNPEPASGGSEP